MLLRVLIADPDEYLVDQYRDDLEHRGFDVVTAATGIECVGRLRKCSPDVLVLEPSLPWGWGDGVLAMMYEEPDVPLVPVIVLTYGRDRSVLYRLAPFKIDDYQVKPLRPAQLAERIGILTMRRQSTAVSAKVIQVPSCTEALTPPSRGRLLSPALAPLRPGEIGSHIDRCIGGPQLVYPARSN